MTDYLRPGVYIEESQRGPAPIEGVPTSIAAFIGETERGSTKPRLVSNFKEYEHWFGSTFGEGKFMPHAVSGFFENGGERVYVCRATDQAATPAEASFGPSFTLRAVGPGSWGKRLYAVVDDSSSKRSGPNNSLLPVGVRLRIAYYSVPPRGDPTDWFDDESKAPFPSISESFDDLEADEQSPNYWYTRLHERSALAELVRTVGAQMGDLPSKGFAQLISNASDGRSDIETEAYEGRVQGLRQAPQGLAALELDSYRDVALVYAPAAPVEVCKAVIAHCEQLRFRFAVIDPEKSASVAQIQPRSELADTKYAALYCPWVVVSDPRTGAHKEVPPGGHVLGVYARTDGGRGVFKAPANQILRGVLGLTAEINEDLDSSLNARGVNSLRLFPRRGIRVWGARTLAADALWKYVSVRRLSIFLERSIYEGIQWVVFEANDERLWARVSDTIRLFLRAQWRQGAMLGRIEEEAFFITCNRTTMTQDDILNGRLICEIGIAPVRPAEFVIFRILQHTAQASDL